MSQSKNGSPPLCGSIDDFFDQTYLQGKWHLGFWSQIIVPLGFACSAGAAQLWVISYILANNSFQSNMLRGDIQMKGGSLAALAFLGKATGALVAGCMGNTRGRRPQLLASLGLISISSVFVAFSPNIASLFLIELVQGLGVGLSLPPLFTLATEFSPPSSRGMFVAIVSSSWMGGAAFVAVAALVLLGFLGLDWRTFCLVSAIPSISSVVLVYMTIPESPRYFVMKGRYKEAAHVANTIAHAYGYRGTRQISEESIRQFYKAKTANEEEEEEASLLLGGSTRSEDGPDDNGAVELLGLRAVQKLYCREMRPITIPLQIASFCLYFCTYGILTWINTIFTTIHLRNVYWNSLLFAVAELPGDIITCVMVDSTGRSSLLTWSMVLSALSLGVFALSATDAETYAAGVILGAVAFQTVSVIGWNSLDCMTGELFPTVIRTTGVGVSTAAGRAGSVVAQFVNGQLAKRPIVLLIVSSVNLLMGAVMAYILGANEMASKPLSDEILPNYQKFKMKNDERKVHETIPSLPNRDNKLSFSGSVAVPSYHSTDRNTRSPGVV